MENAMTTEVTVTSPSSETIQAEETPSATSQAALTVAAVEQSAAAAAAATQAEQTATAAEIVAERAAEEVSEIETELNRVQEWQTRIETDLSTTRSAVESLTVAQTQMAEVLQRLADHVIPQARSETSSPSSEAGADLEKTGALPPAAEAEQAPEPERKQPRHQWL
jgi:hypothetical protein